ncbi:thioredoxin family protein [Jeotgalibacillus soli]|uniref:Thioredoxin n=1 Tax=Jeotgalibacillus soli TaxID=889306 RepID=A0A0C2RLP7_9BACL|nr:thioredoxin family protein [Jeotgalibacillus soli]KIL42674.1 thioredoxin [Jeotgalibacillus soli]
MQEIKTNELFKEVVESKDAVIIKFTAGWCPDCRRMDMFIGDIMEEHNEYKWYEIDRDEFPKLAEKHQVMGIPSLLIFKDGEKLAHLHSANAKSPEQVTEFLSAQK